MTIDELGLDVIRKYPDYAGQVPSNVGSRFLEKNHEYWEYIDDGIIAQQITNLKDLRHKPVSGLWAFFSSMGEANRTEYMKQRAETARALVELETQAVALKNVHLQQQIQVAQVAQAVASAKAAIYLMGVAASRGESVETLQYGKVKQYDTQHEVALEEAKTAGKLAKRAQKQKHEREMALLSNDFQLELKQLEGQIQVSILQAQANVEVVRQERLEMLKVTVKGMMDGLDVTRKKQEVDMEFGAVQEELMSKQKSALKTAEVLRERLADANRLRLAIKANAPDKDLLKQLLATVDSEVSALQAKLDGWKGSL